jgi:hypothetical protein
MPSAPTPPDAGGARRHRRLTGQELLTLQLHARDHRPPQCCAIAGHPEGACAGLLAFAAGALGAGDPASAVDAARRVGLIL